MSLPRDLNPRPADYESAALPAELRRLNIETTALLLRAAKVVFPGNGNKFLPKNSKRFTERPLTEQDTFRGACLLCNQSHRGWCIC